jgi:hypothetical protein
MTSIRRLDVIINRLGTIRNAIMYNPEVEFQIDHLLPVVEVSINALAEEIDDELKELE